MGDLASLNADCVLRALEFKAQPNRGQTLFAEEGHHAQCCVEFMCDDDLAVEFICNPEAHGSLHDTDILADFPPAGGLSQVKFNTQVRSGCSAYFSKLPTRQNKKNL